jgi:hypothetical protein
MNPQQERKFLDAVSFSGKAVVYEESVTLSVKISILSHKKLGAYKISFI